MIWNEFSSQFCFRDEEDSGLSDELTGAEMAGKSSKARAKKMKTSGPEKLLKKFKTASYPRKAKFWESAKAGCVSGTRNFPDGLYY